MVNTPVDRQLMDDIIRESGVTDFSRATIREIKAMAAQDEKA